MRPMLSAIEEMQIIHFLTLKNVLQINNDNRDISNNDINKKHNESKLGSGEALPPGAWHWVGNTESLHSGHGVRYDRGWLVIFTHNPAV